MDVQSLFVLLLGWAALACLAAVPVCLLLRGAAVLEERARRTGEGVRISPPRARQVRRSVRWCVHTTAGTAVRPMKVGRRAR